MPCGPSVKVCHWRAQTAVRLDPSIVQQPVELAVLNGRIERVHVYLYQSADGPYTQTRLSQPQELTAADCAPPSYQDVHDFAHRAETLV